MKFFFDECQDMYVTFVNSLQCGKTLAMANFIDNRTPKYDLDISIDEKLYRLGAASYEMLRSEMDYSMRAEDAFAPSHVADYENWKMTNKRNKR